MIAARKSLGFTLIELLVVIGILAVLLAIVLVAINPSRQFAQANDTQRRSNVNSVLNAIHQYAADNGGNLPAPLASASGGTAFNISSGGTGASFCNALTPTYLAQLPIDPSSGSWTDCGTYDTHYTVTVASSSAGSTARITVSATPQIATSISVTR